MNSPLNPKVFPPLERGRARVGVKSHFKQPDYSPLIPANAAYVPVLAGNFPVAPSLRRSPVKGEGASIRFTLTEY
jgi:hypothetical protein